MHRMKGKRGRKMAQLGYRLMRGRQGASGHIREMGEMGRLFAGGLTPGESYALRGLPGGEKLGEETVDGEGCAVFSCAISQMVFVARGNCVVLWEGEEQGYLLACGCLERERAAKALPDPSTPEEPMEALCLSREDALPSRKEEVLRADVSMPASARDAAIPLPSFREKAAALRAPGPGAPVDALPPLIWPRGTEDIRRYRLACPPIRPFDEPGWRFVRAPSPIRQAAYCAVGWRTDEDWVTGIAYAVPGNAYRPPAPLPGYRYRPGREGMGYWVLFKRV